MAALAPAAGASESDLEAVEIVVPNAYADTDAPGANIFPFACDFRPLPSMRYQQVYAADGLVSGSVNGIAFRLDSAWSGFTQTYADVQITLSTTDKEVNGLATTFSENVGSDVTVVHSGELTLSGATSSQDPRDFDVTIAFQQAFNYDALNGNLLLDVTLPSCTSGPLLDATSVEFPDPQTSRAFSGSSTATQAGTLSETGLITQFTIGAVPPANDPPIVDAGGDTSGEVGEAISLQGSAQDADEDVLTFAWSSDSDDCVIVDATELQASISCSEAGEVRVSLTVSDGTNVSVTDTLILLVVDPVPPEEPGVTEALEAAQAAVAARTPGEFKSRGHATAIRSVLAGIASKIDANDMRAAASSTTNLIRRVDGCGDRADRDDWIVDCEAQLEVRAALEGILDAIN